MDSRDHLRSARAGAGGDFGVAGRGFPVRICGWQLSSFAGSFAGGAKGPTAVAVRTALAGAAGGTAAELTGGDFADGAIAAAYVQMFNDLAPKAVGAFGNGPWYAKQGSLMHRAELGAGKNVFGFDSADAFIEGLRNAGVISRLDIRTHGVSGMMYTGDPLARIGVADFERIADLVATGEIRFSENAVIRNFACNQETLAIQFSSYLGRAGRQDITVIGATGHVSPNGGAERYAFVYDGDKVFRAYRDGKACEKPITRKYYKGP